MPTLPTWISLGVLCAHAISPGCQDRHSSSEDVTVTTTVVPTTVPTPTPGAAPAPGTVPPLGTTPVPAQPMEPTTPTPADAATTPATPTPTPTVTPTQPVARRPQDPNTTVIRSPIDGLPGVTVHNNRRGHETDINVGGIRIEVPQGQ